jgi:hypothetical protein
VLVEGVYQQGSRPLFRYFTFINNPARPDLELIPPLDSDDMARVVKIEVAFDARPTKRTGQTNRVDSSFEDEVFVRTADPTDPEHSPLCD